MVKKNKYVEITTRKVISSYGGVGSLFETNMGSVIIEPFDKWDYSHYAIEKYIRDKDHENLNECCINDERLLNRLRFQFKKLKYLVKIPDNVSTSSYSSDPENKERVINAKYFPEWFYCNRCNSFKHIDEWRKEWEKALANKSRDEIEKSFQEPKCAKCYLEFQNKQKNKSSKSHYNSMFCLEQVRFIMTAPNGDIKDLPWDRWNTAQKESKDGDTGRIVLDFDHKCCDKQDLIYLKSDTFEDYTGVRIKCRNCGKENTLSGLFGLREKVRDTKKIYYKPVLRTSNSVYYPIIFDSLYIPIKEEELLSENKKNTINALSNEDKSPQEIAEILGVELSLVQKVLENDEPAFEDEEQYRLKEYSYITTSELSNQDDLFIAQREAINNLSDFHIDNITRIKRLKMTSVQTGYTRQEPYDRDEFLLNSESKEISTSVDDENHDDEISQNATSMQAKFTSKKGNTTEYLPAIESYGEGVFIKLDDAAIKEWFDSYHEQILERVNKIKGNIAVSGCCNAREFDGDLHFAKFLLLHTLSHILIKEFEFSCGYPATSLSERLYVDKQHMNGLLIYTIAGAEGSYGGLVSHGTDEKFSQLLSSALMRARDCASDPVCYNSDGQGVNGQNLAACYSCALLPETSCEQFNSYLDRAVLIDDEFGFFNFYAARETVRLRERCPKR